jgi:L-lactate dehydrogenase complex protein LldF
VKVTSHHFREQSQQALLDERLQRALAKARGGFVDKRRAALDELPEFEQLRTAAKAIKQHSLANLGEYLLHFEQQVEASGGNVHWLLMQQRPATWLLNCVVMPAHIA